MASVSSRAPSKAIRSGAANVKESDSLLNQAPILVTNLDKTQKTAYVSTFIKYAPNMEPPVSKKFVFNSYSAKISGGEMSASGMKYSNMLGINSPFQISKIEKICFTIPALTTDIKTI